MAVELNPDEPEPTRPSGVQPVPTPYTLRMADVETEGGLKLTRVELALVTGTTILFMDAEWMDKLAQAFVKKASEMRQSTIQVAGMDAIQNLQAPNRGMPRHGGS